MPGNAALLYGAYGYTGQIVAEAMLERGLRPILGGRDAGRLEALATRLGLEARPGKLEQLDSILEDVDVLVLAAGPFAGVVDSAVAACLRTRTHYLDVSGEWASIERVRGHGERARSLGLMLMPAVGFDVVASDCLLLHVARRSREPLELELGVSGLELVSRGSARSIIDQLGCPPTVRRGGKLTSCAPGSLRRAFDFGAGQRECIVTSWGDVVTAQYSTGIKNVTVYFEAGVALNALTLLERGAPGGVRSAPMQAWLRAWVDLLEPGPSAARRATRRACLVAHARGSLDASARLRTPEAYTFTGLSTAAICARVLGGDLEPGFQTPARVWGPDLVLTFAGVEREDLDGLH